MKSYRPRVEELNLSSQFDQVLTEGDMNDYAGDADLFLQQDYLLKLKTQREKIEQLSKMYESNQGKLQKALQDNERLALEISRLGEFSIYKQQLEELKREFDRMAEYSQRSEIQLENVKGQLSQVIHQKSQIILNMKSQLKTYSTRHCSEKQHLESTLTDQESYIQELKDGNQSLCASLRLEIQELKTTISNSRSEFEAQSRHHQDDSSSFSIEIQVKNKELYELHHSMSSIEKESKRLRDEVMGLKEHLQRRQDEYRIQNDRIKRQLQQKSIEAKSKEGSNASFKLEITTLKSKLQICEKELLKSHGDLKSLSEQYEFELNNAKDDISRERAHYQTGIMELRGSIDDLMDVKNQLIAENRKLTRILKKKDEHDKLRKQLLRSECKEIDRMERIVDKII